MEEIFISFLRFRWVNLLYGWIVFDSSSDNWNWVRNCFHRRMWFMVEYFKDEWHLWQFAPHYMASELHTIIITYCLLLFFSVRSFSVVTFQFIIELVKLFLDICLHRKIWEKKFYLIPIACSSCNTISLTYLS